MLRRFQVARHVLEEGRARRVDIMNLAQRVITGRIRLGHILAGMNVVDQLERAGKAQPLQHAPGIENGHIAAGSLKYALFVFVGSDSDVCKVI